MASTSALGQHVAMRDKTYNEHCWIQNAAMKAALDLIPSYENSMNLTVIDYGCSQGNNSIEALQKVLSTLPPGATANLIFEDTPHNDFTTLGATISAHFSPSTTRTDISIFPSMLPIGFYSQVAPTASADLGFSWSSLNYLETIPTMALDPSAGPAEFMAARHKAFSAAGAADLPRLLRLRAREIKSGGYLIAAIGGTSTEKPSNPGFQPLQAAMMKQVRSGKLSMAEMGALAMFPTHERTLEEVQAAIEETKELWVAEHVDAQLIEHPSYKTYRTALGGAGGDEGRRREAVERYAFETLVNLTSSSGWWWIETLRRFRGEGWDGGAWMEGLLGEAVEIMVGSEEWRGARVEIWYNYVKLRRTDVVVEE